MDMKNKVIKSIVKFILEVIIVTVVLVGIDIIVDGMFLIGVPSVEDVNKVTISYPNVTGEIKEVTNKEDIETAVKLTGFLKYSIFKKADKSEEPMITITYYLENNESISVSANNKTVWWKEKTYKLKDDETFINLTEGIFFLDDLVDE